MKKRDIPKPILQKIENELLTGERLLWAGIPGSRLATNQLLIMSLIAGLVSMLIAGIVAFRYSGGALSVVTPAILIIIIALAMLSVAIRQYSKPQAYAISNRRAIIQPVEKVTISTVTDSK